MKVYMVKSWFYKLNCIELNIYKFVSPSEVEHVVGEPE